MAAEGTAPTLLDEEALGYLGRLGEKIDFAQGETILRQGQTGTAFWVILQGEVDVVLRSDNDADQSLLRLGPRETFGELAILRSAPIGADVVAVTPVTVLRYPGDYLPTALAECTPLRHSLLSRMAHNVHRRTSQALTLHKQTRALADLYQQALPASAMIGNSARMRAVGRRIEEAAKSRRPILITGEFGTGKLLAARMIHAASRRKNAPLIAVDCRELTARDANRLLFGTGTASDAELSAERFGALHLAHGGSLVLRGIEALSADTQLELAHHFEAEQEVETRPFPDVRIVATIDTNACGPDDLASSRNSAAPTRITIEIPPLAERPRDIVPLARSFLDEIDHSERLTLTPSAEQALVSLKYRHRNVAELRSVIELAARVADGDEIRAEHIFSGFDGERPIGFDISSFWLVRWLVRGGGLRIARTAVAAFFVAMAVICLAAGRSAPAQSGQWIGVDAVGASGLRPLPACRHRMVHRLSAVEQRPRRPAVVLPRPAAAGVDSARRELALRGRLRPHPVVGGVLPHGGESFSYGILLLALIGSAVVCCILWQREVWCRHLCPLGRLGVALSPVAPLTVAARQSICASTCTTHDCYKGNDKVPGCPVWHHPQLVSEAHRCKTCLTCLQSCPHGSAGLYLRPRLRSAWHLASTESYIVPFALTIFFLSPALILIQKGGVFADPVWLTVACWLSLIAAALTAPVLSPLIEIDGRGTALAAATACALLVLGWGPLMAYQMAHIPFFESLVVVAQPGTLWARWPGPAVTIMSLIRVAWVVFASILSATILWNANGVARKSGAEIRIPGWTALIVVCTIYTFGMLWLVA